MNGPTLAAMWATAMVNSRHMPSITINPAVQFGRPCIEGTRIPASCLAECVAAGAVYPETKREVKQAERWYPWVTDEAFPALAGWSGKVSDIPDPPRLDGA